MPYRQEGERLVFDARTPVATAEPGKAPEPVETPEDPDDKDEEESSQRDDSEGEAEEEEKDAPVSA